jgi:hypothetical protein
MVDMASTVINVAAAWTRTCHALRARLQRRDAIDVQREPV